MKSDINGIVGTRRCESRNNINEVCGGNMLIKEKITSTQTLPCTASCTECGSWFDCNKPKVF